MHRARPFFAAHLQSSLGTGAGYVAILLLAYEQLGNAWGATAVLLADLAPAMLLGPLLGGLIDRTSRLGCAIVADVIGALAFAGLAFLPHSTASLVLLALVAGLSSALLRPATCALLPAIVTREQLTRANGIFGAVREIGQLAGPALAAGVLLVATPSALLAFNAATFAVSALLLIRLRGKLNAPAAAADEPTTATSLRAARPLFVTSAAVMLVAGATNVAELVLARLLLHRSRSVAGSHDDDPDRPGLARPRLRCARRDRLLGLRRRDPGRRRARRQRRRPHHVRDGRHGRAARAARSPASEGGDDMGRKW